MAFNMAKLEWFGYQMLKNIALPYTVFSSYLTLNNIVTLKCGFEVTQGHSNWHHSKAWVRFPIRLMRYSASKCSVTLKTGLGVVQGH